MSSRLFGNDGDRYKLYESEGHTFTSRKDVPFTDGNKASDVVIIVPWHFDGLVVIRQFRKTVGDWIWELPAGKIDPGETAVQAAERELKEETGLDFVTLEWKRPLCFPSVGLTDECSTLIACTVKGKPTNKYAEKDEQIEVHIVDFEYLYSLFIKENTLMDSKLAMIIGGVM